nr:DegT/DnrJ/EryC1/StrS family aminotransferase [Hippea alviniae]
MTDKCTRVDIGSSYLMNEISAAYLWRQLEKAENINLKRLKMWEYYYKEFLNLANKGFIELLIIPKGCKHNAHMFYIFYIKVKDLKTRTKLINFLKENGILVVFHYIPLHSSPAGIKFGNFVGKDEFTTKESERLIRLPLYYSITKDEVEFAINKVKEFFNNKTKQMKLKKVKDYF